MKAADLREKSAADLTELKASLARDVFQNRLKNFTNRLDDTSAMRKTRRDLARVLTVLRAQQRGAAAAPAVPAKAPAAAPTPKKKAAKAASVKKSEAKAAPTEVAPAAAPAKKKSTKKSEAK
jgi:large subunit ribosomal protein L29